MVPGHLQSMGLGIKISKPIEGTMGNNTRVGWVGNIDDEQIGRVAHGPSASGDIGVVTRKGYAVAIRTWARHDNRVSWAGDIVNLKGIRIRGEVRKVARQRDINRECEVPTSPLSHISEVGGVRKVINEQATVTTS